MKDNLNIEELFQDKFSSFEGEVSPDAWANIQQGMAAGAAGTTAATGMSLLMKGVIAGGIVAATVTSVYLFSDTTEQDNTPESNLVVNDQVDNNTNNTVVDNFIQDENLPENTIEGLNVLDGNDDSQVADEDANSFEYNNGPENNGAFITDNNVTDGNTEPGDNTTDNGGDTVDGGSVDDGQSGDGLVDPQNRGPIPNPVAAGVLDGTFEVKQISSNPTFEAGDEFAPTTYIFHANTENARSVEWLFEDGTTLSGEDIEFTFEKPGKYNVTMTAFGDGDPVSESVEVVIRSSASIDTLPNIVTPNGDRINDFFAIATTDIETFEIIVTNSQGVKVYESTDVNFKWNCTDLSGEKLPEGIYYYTFFAKGFDGAEFKEISTFKLLNQ